MKFQGFSSSFLLKIRPIPAGLTKEFKSQRSMQKEPSLEVSTGRGEAGALKKNRKEKKPQCC